MNEKQAELLRGAVKAAEEHPDEFNMNYWVDVDPNSWCGTSGCLAYEICRANGESGAELFAKGPDYVRRKATQLLNEAGPDQWSDRLWFSISWPYEATEIYKVDRVKGVKNMVEQFVVGNGSFNPPPVVEQVEEVLQQSSSQPNYIETNASPVLES